MNWKVEVTDSAKRDMTSLHIPVEDRRELARALASIASEQNPRWHKDICPVMCTGRRLWRYKALKAYRWRGFLVIMDREHIIKLVAVKERNQDTYDEVELNRLADEAWKEITNAR